MANVVIDIAAEFTGNKAFKQADSATTALTKNVKKLAGAVGLAFSTQAIVSFGKAAVKAFAEDEAAALRLNRAVENLGIGFANPAIADYISKLERSAAIADDILRPAFQSLLTTTGSLTKSQELLNNAITISRASGVDLATVTEDLGRGYIGITKGLTKYNTGLTRAELQSKSFNEILGVILKRSAGAAEDYLDTTAYKFDVLSVASSNASEIIGGALVDAFALIGGGTEASDAAYAIETIATALAKVTVQTGRTIGVIPTLIKNLKNLPRNIFQGFAGAQLGVNVIPPTAKEEAKLTLTEKKQQELLAKMEKEALKREKERLALLNKQNVAKRLQGVIDKANLALGKGSDVFDLDKIQVAAALTNQAEQLGKATSSAQLLQITNDTARLNVKRSMLDLEDAIATKDEAAIKAATNKLNADLGILGTLMKQDLKMQDIKSVLESLKPKDLINLGNLDAAIAKMIELNKLQGSKNGTAPTAAQAAAAAAAAADGAPVYSIPKNTTDFTLNNPAIYKLIDKMLPSNSYNEQLVTALNAGADLPSAVRGSNYQARAEQEYAAFLSQINMSGIAGQSLTSGMAQGLPLSNALSGARYAAQGAASYGAGATIVVNTGVGDPNAIAEAIDEVLRQARDRGTLTAL